MIFVSKVFDNLLGEVVKKYLSCYGVLMEFVWIGGICLGMYYLEIGIGEWVVSVVYDCVYLSFV